MSSIARPEAVRYQQYAGNHRSAVAGSVVDCGRESGNGPGRNGPGIAGRAFGAV